VALSPYCGHRRVPTLNSERNIRLAATYLSRDIRDGRLSPDKIPALIMCLQFANKTLRRPIDLSEVLG
jgi:hypothetical protein